MPKTYEEYYQYYKDRLDKAVKPATLENSPELRALVNAIDNVVNLKMLHYDNEVQRRKYYEALAEVQRKNKRHHHNILFDVAKVAVLMVVAYIAPPLLSEAFPLLCELGSIGSAVGTGAALGATDAELQGVGMVIGAQDKFSFPEVLESAVTGGVGEYAKAANLSLEVRAAVVATAAAGTQGLEKVLNMRDKFDPTAIGLQVAGTVIAQGMQQAQTSAFLKEIFGELASNRITTLAVNQALNEILKKVATGQPIDFLGMVTNIVGSVAGDAIIENVIKDILNPPQSEMELEKQEKPAKENDSEEYSYLDDDLLAQMEELDKKAEAIHKSKGGKSNSTEKMIKSLQEKGIAGTRKEYREPSNKSISEMLDSLPDLLDRPLLPKICPWGINVENIQKILDNYESYQASYTNFPSQLNLMAEYSRVTNLPRAERAEYDALLELGKKAYYHTILQAKKAQQQKAGLAEEILSQLNPALCPKDNPNLPAEKRKFTPINYDHVEDIVNRPPQPPARNPNVYDLTQKEMELYADLTGKFPGLGPFILHTLVKEAAEIRRIAREVAYGDHENRDQAIGEGLLKAAGYYVGAKVFGPASEAVVNKVGERLVSEAAAGVEAAEVAEANGVQQVRKVANTKNMFEALGIKPGSGATNVTEIAPTKGLETSEMASARIATRAESEGGQVTKETVKQPSGGGKSVVKDTWPKTREELHQDLTNKGYKLNKDEPSEGGYVTYAKEGSRVTVKPSGEVIRTGRVWNADKTRKYSERQDYDGNRLSNQSHSTDHFVEPVESAEPPINSSESNPSP